MTHVMSRNAYFSPQYSCIVNWADDGNEVKLPVNVCFVIELLNSFH